MIHILNDNPYRDKIYLSLARSKRRVVSADTHLDGKPTTMLQTIEVLPVLFSRVGQHKELLSDLSNTGCKIFIHIALNLGFEEQKIVIKRKDIGVSAPIFSKAMVELITADVIRPVAHKRELYWVNLGIICVGRIARAEHQSPSPSKPA